MEIRLQFVDIGVPTVEVVERFTVSRIVPLKIQNVPAFGSFGRSAHLRGAFLRVSADPALLRLAQANYEAGRSDGPEQDQQIHKLDTPELSEMNDFIV